MADYEYAETYKSGDVVTCTATDYDKLRINGELSANTMYAISDLSTSSIGWGTTAISVTDAINEMCARNSVQFTCEHCGTECFETCKFTPKCPNCGSLMRRI